jgi:hypothetical protein
MHAGVHHTTGGLLPGSHLLQALHHFTSGLVWPKTCRSTAKLELTQALDDGWRPNSQTLGHVYDLEVSTADTEVLRKFLLTVSACAYPVLFREDGMAMMQQAACVTQRITRGTSTSLLLT